MDRLSGRGTVMAAGGRAAVASSSGVADRQGSPARHRAEESKHWLSQSLPPAAAAKLPPHVRQDVCQQRLSVCRRRKSMIPSAPTISASAVRSSSRSFILSFLLLFFTAFPIVAASPYRPLLSIVDELVEIPDDSSPQERLAKSGPILVDHRPPPSKAASAKNIWMLVSVEDELGLKRRTMDHDMALELDETMPTPIVVAKDVAHASSSASPMPSAFDTGVGNNYSDPACPAFMNSFLSNSSFVNCQPVSLMLQNSISFFNAEKSIVTISEVLDTSCAVDFASCSTLMEALALNLTAAENCGADYALGNPLVVSAELGLSAYDEIFQASCLQNAETSAYCFAEAITNASSPTDSYVYYLPLNVTLPGGSQPTCDKCLQDTMAIFDAATSNRSAAITSTYASAAQLINVNCGPNFVNQSLAAVSTSSSMGSLNSASTSAMLALAMLVAAWVL